MSLPLKIKFLSDGNELEFQNTVKNYNIYRYTKSESKLNRLIGWTNEELEKLLRNKIIEKI